MKKEDLEQPEMNMEGSMKFGKFKDAESLLKAYNNLESEFTKKSQRLSLLETENEKKLHQISKKAEQEKRVDEFVTKFEIAKPFSSALKEILAKDENVDIKEETINFISKSYKTAKDFSEDEEFLNNYIFSNQEIKDKIVRDYLSKITQNSPIKVENGAGSITLTPPKKPATIKEAGKLAKSIIKQK